MVLNRLFHVVESCDPDSYIVITHIFVVSGTLLMPYEMTLSELMSNLFDLLFTHDDPHPTP